MMRFVDLRDAETGYNFAFYDTVRDEFATFNHCQAWDDATELVIDMKAAGAAEAFIERLTGLLPPWVSQST